MKKFISCLAATLLILTSVISPSAKAITQTSLDAINGRYANYDPNDTAPACTASDGGGASTIASGSDNAHAAYTYLASKPGMTPIAAAALVGNMQAESGKKLDPTDTNSIGAFGIVQWLGGRKTHLQSFAASHGKPATDFGIQLDFAWLELTSDYKSSTLLPIEAASTVDEATKVVFVYYEAPGDSTLPNRQANARGLLNLYGGGSPTVATPGTAVGPVAGTTAGPVTVSAGCGSPAVATAGCPVTGPLNPGEYSQSKLASIFGDPGSSSSHTTMDANLVNVNFNGHQVQANKVIAGCLAAVAQDIKAKNIPYTIREMGCYRFDSDNGSSNIGLRSYHTYGAACDINPSTNPFGVGGSELPHDMPDAYVQAFLAHGFTWGGSWHSVKDYMHFEFNGVQP